MTVEQILEQLEAQKNPSVVKRYEKSGEKQPYIGVMMGAINKLSKQHAKRSDLALPLWQTGILDAQLLAIQMFKVKALTQADIEGLVDDNLSLLVLDKLVDKVVSRHFSAVTLKTKWLVSQNLIYQRLAWRIEVVRAGQCQLTTERIDTIISELAETMPTSPEMTKWVMNHCLVEIAVCYPSYREQIIDLTSRLGVYRDMVATKGCTSAYAPDWIAARIKGE